MGLIEKIRSLFKKEQVIPSTNITRYDTSSISIPKYSELSEDAKKVVDGYIEEIDLEKLDTLMLYADEMSEYANANTELLLKLFFRITQKPLESELSRLSDEEIAERKLDALIQREEVGLYKQGLENLEEESTLRAVALEEIKRRESKRKFDFLGLFGRAERLKRKNQMELLELATERMKISKKTIEQQMAVVKNEIESEESISTTLDVYNAISNKDKDVVEKMASSVKEEAQLMHRVDQLLQMASLVIPQDADILRKIYTKVKLDELSTMRVLDKERAIKALAIIQRKLDVYAYTHRKDLEPIRQDVLEIKTQEKITKNREELLSKVNRIQIMYKVFGQYVTPEDLQSLYQAKFDVLTIGANEQEKSPFAEIKDKEEMEHYAKIVEEKLEAILRGNNEEFTREFGKNKTQALNILKKIIRLENGGDFSVEKILTKNRLIGVILAFDKEDGFDDFFYNAKAFNKSDLIEHLDNGTIEWEDKLPLETICELERIVGDFDEKSIKKLSPWVNLVLISRFGYGAGSELIFETVQKNYRELYLPEGITALSFSFNSLHTNPYERELLGLLCDTPDYVRVICPSTLKKIKSPEYHRTSRSNITEIQLNEGLEEIGAYAFENYGFRNIHLPASLNKIGQDAFVNCEKLQEVTFNEGLQKISDEAFMGCTALKRIELSRTLRSIGLRAFEGCGRLEEVIINEGLQKISDEAFMGCTALKRIELPRSLRSIGLGAFEGCERLEEVIINEGLEIIGRRAFANNHSLRTFSAPTHKIELMGDIFEIDKGPSWRNGISAFYAKIMAREKISLRLRGMDINEEVLETYKVTDSSDPIRRRFFNERIKSIEVSGTDVILRTSDPYFRGDTDVEIRKIKQLIQKYKQRQSQQEESSR